MFCSGAVQSFPGGSTLEQEPGHFPGNGVGATGTSVGISILLLGLECKIIKKWEAKSVAPFPQAKI